ncbi:multicopper oxidase family protein [Alkalihalobacillus macyae]|uniref:multicopper oxidase family protein n=1 Tax=Guptibacillus hwajinpoensis TaxID=208199 RepID=UPI00273CEA82|nr:multicopper oxidase family protein [Alkalihalobacillus macyae]MDP4552327.1 multicopper oxidase family protein [Alkalihalobacillus macyae]
MKKVITILSLSLLFILAACSENDSAQTASTTNDNQVKVEAQKEEFDGKKLNEFELIAQASNWDFRSDESLPVWTFNGTVPGKEIRVKEGEALRVTLKNQLEEPTSIHWHGVPLSNKQDGIPGITQDAVRPGETFIYEFVANDPGTYWYHSHQNGVKQLDKGLYGTLIVEPKDGTNVDEDYTLVLDEWESGNNNNPAGEGMMDDTNDQEGKDSHEESSGGNMDEMMAHDMSSYDLFTINGKASGSVEPLKVNRGEKVKLRFINAGYMAHKMHIPVDYRVTHVDGQEINNPMPQSPSLLEIAPGERYDIEFIADQKGAFTIDSHDEMKGADNMNIDVIFEDEPLKTVNHQDDEDLVIGFGKLGENKEGPFSLDDQFDIEYNMELGVQMNHESMDMEWTINNETFPDTSPLKVNKDDKVKVTLTNDSKDNSVHPMHLHGHFFQVLSKNGKELKGAPIIKDTLNVKPGETYEVAFLADNPGNWLFHCHDLHHASNGMVTLVKYNNFKEFYKSSGDVENMPE